MENKTKYSVLAALYNYKWQILRLDEGTGYTVRPIRLQRFIFKLWK